MRNTFFICLVLLSFNSFSQTFKKESEKLSSIPTTLPKVKTISNTRYYTGIAYSSLSALSYYYALSSLIIQTAPLAYYYAGKNRRTIMGLPPSPSSVHYFPPSFLPSSFPTIFFLLTGLSAFPGIGHWIQGHHKSGKTHLLLQTGRVGITVLSQLVSIALSDDENDIFYEYKEVIDGRAIIAVSALLGLALKIYEIKTLIYLPDNVKRKSKLSLYPNFNLNSQDISLNLKYEF